MFVYENESVLLPTLPFPTPPSPSLPLRGREREGKGGGGGSRGARARSRFDDVRMPACRLCLRARSACRHTATSPLFPAELCTLAGS